MDKKLDNLSIEVVSGNTIENYIDDLARLRIGVFHEFPYIYKGNLEYEKNHLKHYSQDPRSVVVVAKIDGRVVGASTAKPMASESVKIIQPWLEQNSDIPSIFYYGESVLEKEYRGYGIGLRFFVERENWARSFNEYKIATFCAVIRPENHPLKPVDYQPLDHFWNKRGFTKTDNLVCEIPWLDRNESTETLKKLVFWKKDLN